MRHELAVPPHALAIGLLVSAVLWLGIYKLIVAGCHLAATMTGAGQ